MNRHVGIFASKLGALMFKLHHYQMVGSGPVFDRQQYGQVTAEARG
jgi:hypothetical protein